MRFPGNLQQPEDYEEEFYRNKLDNELTFDKRLFEKDAYGTLKPHNGESLWFPGLKMLRINRYLSENFVLQKCFWFQRYSKFEFRMQPYISFTIKTSLQA